MMAAESGDGWYAELQRVFANIDDSQDGIVGQDEFIKCLESEARAPYGHTAVGLCRDVHRF